MSGNVESEEWFVSRMEQQVRSLAQGLQVPAYREIGRDMCLKVIECLKMVVSSAEHDELGPFKLADTFLGGSYAKGTDALNPGFDVVFRMAGESNHLPVDFSRTLGLFKTILEQNVAPLNILPIPVEKTPTMLRFEFVNGAQVNLMLATNEQDPKVIVEQIKPQARNAVNRRLYGNSLMEYQNQIIAQLPETIKDCIRLAKLWKTQCDFTGDIPGLNEVLEWIGLAVALELPEGQPILLVRSLIRMFEMVEAMDTLKLVFRKVDGSWKRVKPAALTPGAMVPESVVGFSDMLKRQRLLLAPLNPFNDILENTRNNDLRKIMDFGRIMKKRLQLLANDKKYCVITGGEMNIQFAKLFEPIPLHLTKRLNHLLNDLPSQVNLSQDRFQHRRRQFSHRPSQFLDVNIRRSDVFVETEMRETLKLLKWRILGVIACSVPGGLGGVSGATSDAVFASVAKLLGDMLPPLQTTITGLDGTMRVAMLDAFDATISIPYATANVNSNAEQNEEEEFCYGTRVSLKWGNE